MATWPGPPVSARPSERTSRTSTASTARRRMCTPGCARAGDPVGLSTVYRAVQSLADDGELDSLRTDTGEALYRRCSPQHHHHLVCRGCGLTVEVEGPAVERWADRIAGEHGFADVSHTLEIFGTCACRGAERGSRPARPSRADLGLRRASLAEVAHRQVGAHVDEQDEGLAAVQVQGERGDVRGRRRVVDHAVERALGEAWTPPRVWFEEVAAQRSQAWPLAVVGVGRRLLHVGARARDEGGLEVAGRPWPAPSRARRRPNPRTGPPNPHRRHPTRGHVSRRRPGRRRPSVASREPTSRWTTGWTALWRRTAWGRDRS